VFLPLHYKNAAKAFSHSSGWKLELSEARMTLGAIRCRAGEPAYSLLLPAMYVPVLGMKNAYAHPGHYLPEGVTAELIITEKLDLLARSQSFFGLMHGFTGQYGSMEVEFSDQHQLSVKGAATKGSQFIRFAFVLKPGAYTVGGIPFSHNVDGSLYEIMMSVSMERLFAWVVFASFDQTTSPAVPDQGSMNALKKALKSNALYQFTLKEKASK
jgi:hypothetical protein